MRMPHGYAFFLPVALRDRENRNGFLATFRATIAGRKWQMVVANVATSRYYTCVSR